MICRNCDDNIIGESVQCSVCSSPLHDDCKVKCIKCFVPLCYECATKNKFICNECKVVTTFDMEFISSTMFESYYTCPFAFKHEMILGSLTEEERNNKYSVIGNLLHDLFEKYSQIRPLTEEVKCAMELEFSELYDQISTELFNDPEDMDSFRSIAYNTLCHWFDNELSMIIPFEVEKQHFIKLHDKLPTIRVTIDRINKEDDNYTLIDYKTGKVYSSDKLRDNMQLPIYAMAIRHIYGKLPTSLTLYFPQHQTKRVFELISDDLYVCKVPRGGTYTMYLPECLNKMIEIYEKIKVGEFTPNTKNQHFCNNFCAVNRKGLCEGLITSWRLNERKWK